MKTEAEIRKLWNQLNSVLNAGELIGQRPASLVGTWCALGWALGEAPPHIANSVEEGIAAFAGRLKALGVQ